MKTNRLYSSYPAFGQWTTQFNSELEKLYGDSFSIPADFTNYQLNLSSFNVSPGDTLKLKIYIWVSGTKSTNATTTTFGFEAVDGQFLELYKGGGILFPFSIKKCIRFDFKYEIKNKWRRNSKLNRINVKFSRSINGKLFVKNKNNKISEILEVKSKFLKIANVQCRRNSKKEFKCVFTFRLSVILKKHPQTQIPVYIVYKKKNSKRYKSKKFIAYLKY